MNIIFSKQVTVNISYKFFLKSSRKLLTNTHYYHKKYSLTRGQNTHLMFVRAPKHFKTGKQIIVFFNSVYTYRKLLNFKYQAQWIYKFKPQVLFHLITKLRKEKLKNDIIISRVTLSSLFFVSFNGGCGFYANNN